MYQLPEIWAGSQSSFDTVVEALPRVEAMIQARGSRSDDPDLPPMYEVVDRVAIVDVSGPLIAGSAGWFRLFGVTGYDDIQAAVTEALGQKGVSAWMLSIASGGGDVNGCDECSEFLSEMARVRPLVTHARSTMASAAYWLGSSAGPGRIFATRTSLIGSIGVLAVHKDYSGAFKKDGIDVTVLREGQYKALGNPYEPLSKEARAKIQSQMAYTNTMFEERVASNLGATRERVHDKMGDGREFVGAQAIEPGLIHAVASSQEAHSVAKLLIRS